MYKLLAPKVLLEDLGTITIPSNVSITKPGTVLH